MHNNYICIYCNSSYEHKVNFDLHRTYCKKKPKKSIFQKLCNIVKCNITL